MTGASTRHYLSEDMSLHYKAGGLKERTTFIGERSTQHPGPDSGLEGSEGVRLGQQHCGHSRPVAAP